MIKITEGQTVNVHYIGTFDDGTEFDNSYPRGEPISFQVGSNQLIKGFDQAIHGMTIGETKKIRLNPEQAYGEILQEAYQTVPQSAFPPDFDFEVGVMVQGENQGQPVRAIIESVSDNTVVLNFNHPLAGKDLNFQIELVSIEEGDKVGESNQNDNKTGQD